MDGCGLGYLPLRWGPSLTWAGVSVHPAPPAARRGRSAHPLPSDLRRAALIAIRSSPQKTKSVQEPDGPPPDHRGCCRRHGHLHVLLVETGMRPVGPRHTLGLSCGVFSPLDLSLAAASSTWSLVTCSALLALCQSRVPAYLARVLPLWSSLRACGSSALTSSSSGCLPLLSVPSWSSRAVLCHRLPCVQFLSKGHQGLSCQFECCVFLTKIA